MTKTIFIGWIPIIPVKTLTKFAEEIAIKNTGIQNKESTKDEILILIFKYNPFHVGIQH